MKVDRAAVGLMFGGTATGWSIVYRSQQAMALDDWAADGSVLHLVISPSL